MRVSRAFSLAAVVCVTTVAQPVAALDIALTNDDGWDAMGIQVMRSALVAAGHNVTLAAPLTDQSGSSLALDMAPLAVKKEAAGQYSVALWPAGTVAAKPANSALVAIGIMEEGGRLPDLLISGINTSANIGMAAMLSGTVGAAAHAAVSVMNGPVPAIAVGTDEPTCDATCKQAHYEKVAGFIVRFVAHLETKPGFLASEPALLPRGLGLIVSYPPATPVLGVKIATLSNGLLVNAQKYSGGIYCAGTGCSGIAVGATQRARVVLAPDDEPDVKNADLASYAAGYVTIVPIVPDLTAGTPLVFKSMLSGFKP